MLHPHIPHEERGGKRSWEEEGGGRGAGRRKEELCHPLRDETVVSIISSGFTEAEIKGRKPLPLREGSLWSVLGLERSVLNVKNQM